MTQDFTFFAGPETGLLKVDLSPLHDKIAALEKELADAKWAQSTSQTHADQLLRELYLRDAKVAALERVFPDGASITINGLAFVVAEGDAFEASVCRAYDSQANYRIVVRRL